MNGPGVDASANMATTSSHCRRVSETPLDARRRPPDRQAMRLQYAVTPFDRNILFRPAWGDTSLLVSSSTAARPVQSCNKDGLPVMIACPARTVNLQCRWPQRGMRLLRCGR